MHRTYRYRLYPTVEQSHVLDLLLWQGRRMYNAALTQRIAPYQQTGKGPSYVDQCAYFKEQRTGFSEIYGLLNATSVQQMLRRLDKSFTAFFRRLKQGHKPGFPRFKARNRFHSLEYRHGDGCKMKYDRQQSRFYVQNVGDIKVKYHRPLPEEAQLGHVVIKQSLGRCYVCLLVELPNPKPVEHSGPTVGIDIGLKSLLALSDGTRVDNPRWLRQSLGKLRIAQRRLARRKRGRNRRRKAAFQVAQCHEKVRQQRLDFWHKLTRFLVQRYSALGLEDFSLAFMTHNQHLSLSAHDAGLGLFRQLLDYKAEDAGSQVIAVNAKNTTQACSGGGGIVRKAWAMRVHSCPDCERVLDRDINAARTIKNLALHTLGRSDQASTWADARPCVA